MKLRGFRKGIVLGAIGAFALSMLGAFNMSRHGAPWPPRGATIFAAAVVSIVFGLVCGLLAIAARRFGRAND